MLFCAGLESNTKGTSEVQAATEVTGKGKEHTNKFILRNEIRRAAKLQRAQYRLHDHMVSCAGRRVLQVGHEAVHDAVATRPHHGRRAHRHHRLHRRHHRRPALEGAGAYRSTLMSCQPETGFCFVSCLSDDIGSPVCPTDWQSRVINWHFPDDTPPPTHTHTHRHN